MKIIHKEYVKKHKVVIPFADLRDGESGKCVKWFEDNAHVGDRMWREGLRFYQNTYEEYFSWGVLDCKANREGVLLEVERERV